MPTKEAKRLSESMSSWKQRFPDPSCCPIRAILDHAGSKWNTLIILTLAVQPLRFRELHRTIGNISQRILTQNLRDLQRDGLIARVVHPTRPPSVEYKLTPLGSSMLIPLLDLVRWAESNQKIIRKARDHFIQNEV